MLIDFGSSPYFVTKDMMVIEKKLLEDYDLIPNVFSLVKCSFKFSWNDVLLSFKVLGVSCEGRWKLGCTHILVH